MKQPELETPRPVTPARYGGCALFASQAPLVAGPVFFAATVGPRAAPSLLASVVLVTTVAFAIALLLWRRGGPRSSALLQRQVALSVSAWCGFAFFPFGATRGRPDPGLLFLGSVLLLLGFYLTFAVLLPGMTAPARLSRA